nr:hypothetical protein XPJYXGBL_XPJYXGBL_CDS_0005 [Microvirus sp.]
MLLTSVLVFLVIRLSEKIRNVLEVLSEISSRHGFLLLVVLVCPSVSFVAVVIAVMRWLIRH